ncbi:NAD(P)/FAD-dependent oxidoreductase [Vibrio penaeicida]|uniref:NAD(P)/FAD-dependent oxidoreductase n=1 Tax=Vibrio penaeicida TaxID=104609 RepID=UPI000CEA22E8|nr:FAD-dependent oxidoreductase [Vibrio penaeicida]
MSTNQRQFDWVIIGAGVIGCAIARELSLQSNFSVALIEQNRVGSGATLYSGGFVRVIHSEDHITEMAKESLPFFLQHKEETGFDEIGTLFVPTTESLATISEWVRTTSTREHPIYLKQVKSLPEELRKILPKRLDADYVVWEPVSGYADPLKSTLWLSNEAQKNGVELFESTQVQSIDTHGFDGFQLTTSDQVILTNGLIVCTGAWNSLAGDAFDLTDVQRPKAIQAEFMRSQPLPSEHPALIVGDPDVYMRPIGGDTWLVGTATSEWDIDVESPRRKDITHTNLTKETVSQALNIQKDALNALGARVGFDGYTYGKTGYLGAKSKYKNVLFATGWSGMGFKLFPSIAKRISHLATQSRNDVYE